MYSWYFSSVWEINRHVSTMYMYCIIWFHRQKNRRQGISPSAGNFALGSRMWNPAQRVGTLGRGMRNPMQQVFNDIVLLLGSVPGPDTFLIYIVFHFNCDVCRKGQKIGYSFKCSSLSSSRMI